MDELKTINVTFSKKEYNIILKAKGKQSWHDYILNTIGITRNEQIEEQEEETEDEYTQKINKKRRGFIE